VTRNSFSLLPFAFFLLVACSRSPGTTRECDAANVSRTAVTRFPLRVEAGKRYLVDSQGAPFLIQGDSAWSLMVQLTTEDAEAYLEKRRQQGFNAVLVKLIEHYFADDPPSNVYGDAPFLTPGDFSAPNETYFAHAACVISMAAERGMLVMLAPAYLGFSGGDQGWYAEMKAVGGTRLRAYGKYLANRFKAYDNILWVHGGDYNPPEQDLLVAVVNGIRDVDAERWLHSFHGARGTAGLEFFRTTPSWLQVNNIYSDRHTVVADAHEEYHRSTLPFFLIEAKYEGEGVAAAGVRQQAYQAVLSGASGHVIGNTDVWRFTASWRRAMDLQGARTVTHMRTLLDGRSWWNLAPDVNGALLTSDVGVGADRAAAALAMDGSSALIHTPSMRALTVNLGALAGPRVAARWYDPAAGAYAAIPGFPAAASGVHTLSPKGNNAGGSADWVLVLESVPDS